MFDDGISAEYPEHEEWIYGYAIYELKERYGLETKIVQVKTTYCQYLARRFFGGKPAHQPTEERGENGERRGSLIDVLPALKEDGEFTAGNGS
jgi:hypothetical protein